MFKDSFQQLRFYSLRTKIYRVTISSSILCQDRRSISFLISNLWLFSYHFLVNKNFSSEKFKYVKYTKKVKKFGNLQVPILPWFFSKYTLDTSENTGRFLKAIYDKHNIRTARFYKFHKYY